MAIPIVRPYRGPINPDDPSTTEEPITSPEGQFGEWVKIDYNQAKRMQAWCVPKTMMTSLSKMYNADAEMYCDHSAYYRETELMLCQPAWGGLLSGPSWNRFVVWWRKNYRMVNVYTEADKFEKGYRITKLFENETWEYMHGISHGLTKFVAPSEDVNYRQLNYLILQMCNYYLDYDTRHWKSPY